MTDLAYADAGQFVAGIGEFLQSPPAGNFMEFGGHWWSGQAVALAGRQLEALLQRAGVSNDVAIGVLIRNRPGHAAALIGLIGSGRPVVALSTILSDTMIAEDIERLGLGVIVAEGQDWGEALLGCLSAGRIGITFPEGTLTPSLIGSDPPAVADQTRRPALCVALLTSGTTGAPKRIELGAGALMRGRDLLAVVDPSMVGRQVEIHWHHFSSIGGMLLLVTYAAYRLPFSLLEKFDLAEWTAAVRRNGSRVMPIAPPVVRELLASDLPGGALGTAEVLYGGGGALEPEAAAECEKRFGVMICWAYGATEFAGTLASWTRELRARYGDSKPGSCGKPLPGVAVRITDIDSGEPVFPGETGRLEAFIPAMSADWIRTNDLASLDEDGFLFVLGRLDGAINRGGFKVLPDAVASTLRRHPSVVEAVVFGLPDARLGEVPVAAVELKAGGDTVTADALRQFCREHLAATSVPVEIRVVESLPRSLSAKVDLPRLKRDWAAGSA